ncbi:MAG: benzoate-CoA ligase family protein [Gammaproteobacteria bacterium]
MVGCSGIDVETCPPALSIPRSYNAACDFIDCHLKAGRTGNIAVIDETGSYTYADLAERVNRAGNAFIALGISRNDRVAMALPDGIDFPSVFWGCIKAGIIPIPLNTLLTTSDYEYILTDSRARTLVISAALFEKFEPLIEKPPFLKNIIIAGSENKSPYPLLTELMNRSKPLLEAAPTSRDDIAFWLYSSGSTGMPKGVMHRHSHLIQTAALYGIGILAINETDRMYSAAKLFFAYGLGNGMSFPFLVGATAILLSGRPTPETVMDIIKHYKPTIFFGVPVLFAGILADPNNRPAPGSHCLRVCVSAGEALPEEIGRRFGDWFGVPVLDGIGSTEMLHIFLSNRMDDPAYGTSGKPVPGYEVKLVNEEGEQAGINEMGELLVSGPSAAAGYWKQQQKSRQTFQGRWTCTGDKYRVDENGYYTYCGRTDDMLKVSGQWVSPFEVESVLIQHAAVLEAAVAGMRDENNLPKPKAYVVLKPGIDASAGLAAEIQAFVKARLAKHKYPRWIEFVDALPKTATGKIQRFKLRQ